MNLRSWHIPAGISVSFLAHVGVISLIVGAAHWSSQSDSPIAIQRPVKIEPSAMETYPTFQDQTAEEEKPEPNFIFQPKSEQKAIARPLEKPPAPRYPPPTEITSGEMEQRFPTLFD